jgi:hypothetical protein
MTSDVTLQLAKAAVVTAGSGRGFVIERGVCRYVVTAAHCLPTDDEGCLILPPATAASYTEERTYSNLLAPFGGLPTVWTECLFVDPVADVAVLGSPDDQVLYEQAEAYNALMESAAPIAISDMHAGGPAWLLSLEGKWFQCSVDFVAGFRAPLWLSNAAEGIKGGMSGSPIISAEGAAIGIVCCAMSGGDGDDEHTEGGPNPRLVHHLPGWLLRKQPAPRRRKAGEVTRVSPLEQVS